MKIITFTVLYVILQIYRTKENFVTEHREYVKMSRKFKKAGKGWNDLRT